MRVIADELRDQRMAMAEQKAASLPPMLTVPVSSPVPRFASHSADGDTVRPWRFNHAGRVVMARLDPSGRFAFTADSRQASIWDLKTGKEHSRLQYDHRFEVYTSARFANGGNWLITGAPSRQLSLWQVSDGSLLQSWRVSPHPRVKPPSAVVYGVALRDNSHLVSASSSGLAEIWTIK